MGNGAGIACDITPKEKEDKPVICSLTQLEIMESDPLRRCLPAGTDKKTYALPRQRADRFYGHAESQKIAGIKINSAGWVVLVSSLSFLSANWAISQALL